MSDNGIQAFEGPQQIWWAKVEVPEAIKNAAAYRDYAFTNASEWYLQFVEVGDGKFEPNYGEHQCDLNDPYIAAYEEFRDAIFKHYQPELEQRVAEVRKHSASDVVNAKGVIGKSIAPDVDLHNVDTIETPAGVIYSVSVAVPKEIADNMDFSEAGIIIFERWKLEFMISETGEAYLPGDHFSELEGAAAVEKELAQALLEHYRNPLERDIVRVAKTQGSEPEHQIQDREVIGSLRMPVDHDLSLSSNISD